MSETTPRRSFLGRLIGLAAATGLPIGGLQTPVSAQPSGPDDWMKEVRGTHRCLFDFPKHLNGFAQLHILNYLGTYSAAYKVGPGQAGAVGTFYGIGPGASIALGFDDAMWAKYGLGEYHGLKDASGRAYTRNVFHRPTKADSHLLAQGLQAPNFAMLGDAVAGLGIESLQKMGTKFILCANALQAWALELEARGKGQGAAIEADLRAHLLPGVTIVPAMVIAIDKAQAAGMAYNRQ